jgi:hypothetical protein
MADMKIVKAVKNPSNYQKSLTRGYRSCMDAGYDNYALVAWNGKTGAFDAYYNVDKIHAFVVPHMAEKILTHVLYQNTEPSDE